MLQEEVPMAEVATAARSPTAYVDYSKQLEAVLSSDSNSDERRQENDNDDVAVEEVKV